MNIELLHTNDPTNKITKTTSTVLSLSGTLKEESSIIDPIITVETNADIFGANYAYIEAFHRFYFIRDIVVVDALHFRIHMHVDVLMSFSAGLLNCQCIMARSTDRFNLNLNDPNYKCFQQDLILYNSFASGFDLNNSYFIMTVFADTGLEPEP